MAHEDVHILIPMTCDCYLNLTNGTLQRCDYVMDVEMGG